MEPSESTPSSIVFQLMFGEALLETTLLDLGPHIFPGVLNGNLYLDFLQNHLPGLLEDISLSIQNRIIFQQDEKPTSPHYSLRVRRYLNHNRVVK